MLHVSLKLLIDRSRNDLLHVYNEWTHRTLSTWTLAGFPYFWSGSSLCAPLLAPLSERCSSGEVVQWPVPSVPSHTLIALCVLYSLIDDQLYLNESRWVHMGKLMQIGVNWCKLGILMQIGDIDANWGKLIQIWVNCGKSMQIGVNWCKFG